MKDMEPCGAPLDKRMKFAEVCALMPDGVNWGDRLTPQIARELVEASVHWERKRLEDAARLSGRK